MIDIINSYVDAGYDCVLITGRLVERNKKLSNSVTVDRIIKYERNSVIKRLFTWITGFIQIWIKVAFRYRNDSLFIVSNPPIAPLLRMVVKNRFSLLIFDVYPDAFSELGYLDENSFILKWWRKANRKVYSKAVNIFTITESMKLAIQKYVTGKKIVVVPVWTDNTFLKPVDPAINPFLKRYNLSGKFVVLYSGNLGLSGDADVLVDVAAMIGRDDIIFVIIGDGAKKNMISSKIEKLGLTNILMLPWQPVSELPFSLSSASLAVVTLGKNASKLAIPSKFYNFLSVGSPLLCIAEHGSEIENLVTRFNCGKCFESSDISGISDFVIIIADNIRLQKEYGANALKAAGDFNQFKAASFLEVDTAS
jgi:glycosyltransferase involved in cell wall biosynthesis